MPLLAALPPRGLRTRGGAGRFRGGAAVEYATTPHKLAVRPARPRSTRCSGVSVPAGRGPRRRRARARRSRSVILRGSTTSRELFAARARAGRARQIAAAADDRARGEGVHDDRRGRRADRRRRRRRRLRRPADARTRSGRARPRRRPRLRARGARDLRRRARRRRGQPPRARGDPRRRRAAPTARLTTRCQRCGEQLTHSRHARASRSRDLGPSFSGCLDSFVLPSAACPHCATVFGARSSRRRQPPARRPAQRATQTALVSR